VPKLFRGLLIVCLASALSCIPAGLDAREEKPVEGSTLTFYQENDLYTGSDRDYTNGIKLTWISPDLAEYREDPRLPSWSIPLIDALPFTDGNGYRKTISLSVGQDIYTPTDTKSTNGQDDDRPYAGISYLAVGFNSRNTRVMNAWEITLGIVGPHSYAEEMQKAVHEWTNSDYPMGWERQIEDELLLNLSYERAWRFPGQNRPRGLSYDVIPHAGCAVGNALTALNLGGQLRFGWNLPSDFGTFPIRAGTDSNAPIDGNDPRCVQGPPRYGVHAFVAVDGYAVLWNVTLDGNFMRHSDSLDKKPFTARVSGGFGLVAGRFKITYALVTRTREYETQDKHQSYGTLTISYTFRS